MAINVDGYADGQGVQAPGAGRQRLHTEARQGRWLYELEHALLLQSGKKPEAEGAADHKAGNDDPLRKPQRERAAARARDDGAGTASGGAAPAAPLTAVAGQAAGAADPAVGAPVKAGAAQATSAADTSAPAAAAGPHGADADAPAWSPAWSAAAVTPSSAAVLGAYGAAMAPRAPVSAPAGAGAAVAAPEAPARTLPGLAMAADAGAPPAREAEAEAEPDAEPAPENGAAPTDGDEYAQRLLHVYRDAQGVQAWIRDAAIGPAQIPALAQAMAGELGAVPLAALTVNGRRQALPGGAARDQNTQDDYIGGEGTGDHTARTAPPRDINATGAA